MTESEYTKNMNQEELQRRKEWLEKLKVCEVRENPDGRIEMRIRGDDFWRYPMENDPAEMALKPNVTWAAVTPRVEDK